MLGIAYLKRFDNNVPRRLLGIATVIVLLVAGAWYVSQRHEKDPAFYAPRHNVRIMPLLTWQTDGWRELPAWRVDMAGERKQPLIIQWAGLPDELAGYLLTEGWRRPATLNLKNFLGMLSPETPLEMLPVLPHLHDGRSDRLRLVRKVDGQRWVLRLWVTDTQIQAKHTPLFVGTIDIQKTFRLAGLITMERQTGEYDRPLDAFKSMLDDRYCNTAESVPALETGNEINIIKRMNSKEDNDRRQNHRALTFSTEALPLRSGLLPYSSAFDIDSRNQGRKIYPFP